jgi:hypothetical protein
VSHLKNKIPKNLGRQRCAEGFNSGVKGSVLSISDLVFGELDDRSLFLSVLLSAAIKILRFSDDCTFSQDVCIDVFTPDIVADRSVV